MQGFDLDGVRRGMGAQECLQPEGQGMFPKLLSPVRKTLANGFKWGINNRYYGWGSVSHRLSSWRFRADSRTISGTALAIHAGLPKGHDSSVKISPD
jgi:hypothetical protein